MKKILLTEVKLDDQKYLVRRRLNLVKKLNSISEKFDDIEDKTDVGDRGYIYESFSDYQALRFYLLLTCFDVLGQHKKYDNFTAWIGKKDNSERDELISSNSKKTPLEICKILNDGYNKIYGTRNSFRTFIKSIMSSANRERLLESILIRKTGSGSDLFKDENGMTTETGKDKKLEFLFNARNLFTHQALSTANGGAPITKKVTGNEEGKFPDQDEKIKCGYFLVFSDNEFDYYVREWPSVLIEIIEEELNGYTPYWIHN